MKRNYSHFNKTYQYLCFQEQIAHKKNLKSVKSVQQSNVKAVKASSNNKSRIAHPPSQNNSKKHTRTHSLSQFQRNKSQLIQKPKSIHKNRPYQYDWNVRRIQENRRIAHKLMNTSCSIITRDQSFKEFQSHQKYKEFARVYPKQGKNRKDLLKLSTHNSSVLSYKSIQEGQRGNPQSLSGKFCTVGKVYPSYHKQSAHNQRYW